MKDDDLNLSLSKKIFCNSNSNNVNTINNLNSKMTSKSSTSVANHNIKNGIDSNKANPKKITADDYRFGRMIGEGSYSTVYLAKDIHTNKEFAIKVCDKEHILKERKEQYVKREREALHQLSSTQGFVNLICTFQDPKNLYFVTTFAKNGELLPNINKVGSFDLNCTKFYAAELLLSIEEMHKRRIIHRDLKPENILLDNEMHLMVADFGSSRILPDKYDYKKESQIEKERAAKEAAEKEANDSSDEEYHRKAHGRYSGRRTSEKVGEYAGERKNSFVGTAQYVSPEVLSCSLPHLSTDLWALGCIIYQMISGLPPFRGPTEFLIFRKVSECKYEFPEGFDEDAKDLVQKLIRLDPLDRLGSGDFECCRYNSIRNHKFFNEIVWDDLRSQTPPTINPYLPGNGQDEELRSDYHVNYDTIEPGLGSKQLRRLLEMELGTNISVKYPNILNLSDHDMKRKLESQKESPWNDFVKNDEVIFKHGYINKRKGLFSRRRMLLLTLEPRLIYIDPSTNIKKGEIPFCSALDCEPKNFKIFFVHTPNRTYYLEDPEGYALEWCKQINNIRDSAFGKPIKLN